MRVFLLRHAQTRGNLSSNYIGKTDEPLAPEGIATARKAMRDESVKTVHASTRRRAVETAAILFPNAEIRSHSGLDEMDFGRFEGKGWRELERDEAYSAWLATRCEARCPDGESKEEFTRRCRETFSAIVRQCREEGGDAAHFVVHGGVIMAIMSGFTVPERDYFEWKAGFCGGFVMEHEPESGRFALLRSVDSPGTGELA